MNSAEQSLVDEIAAQPGLVSAEASRPSFFARHWQKLVAAAIWVVLIAALFWYTRTNDLTLSAAVLQLIETMQSSAYGPLLYILIYALRPLTLFSAVLLTIAGGFLFGPVWGVVFTVIAANTSAMVAYFIGRYFGQDALKAGESQGLIQRYAGRMRENSFETVLIMRFIFLPYDLVNYLAGFLRIDWKAFLFATALGSIPGTISFVLLGASLTPEGIRNLFISGELPSLNTGTLVISVALFVVSLLLSRYFKRREGQAAPAEMPADAAAATVQEPDTTH